MSSIGSIVFGGISILFAAILAVYSFNRAVDEEEMVYYIITIFSVMSFIYCVNSLWFCIV